MLPLYRAVLSFTVALLGTVTACGQSPFESRRTRLVEEIEAEVRRMSDSTGKTRLDEPVTAAMGRVPRHEFVPPELRELAYENRPLSIGEGQTISQPSIVALMTDLASIDRNSVVLEIGTGSGYQAAVLAELADHVYTIEIVEPLGRRAKETLQRLGYENVSVRIGDGFRGWPEHAPFDAILVTAAPEEVPRPLIEQLKTGGRLVAPIGAAGGEQFLQVMEKGPEGEIKTRNVIPVAFVPFTREN